MSLAGYPYNLDFDYGALAQLQHFSINNLGDPFIESTNQATKKIHRPPPANSAATNCLPPATFSANQKKKKR
jgi:hypothetical protein